MLSAVSFSGCPAKPTFRVWEERVTTSLPRALARAFVRLLVAAEPGPAHPLPSPKSGGMWEDGGARGCWGRLWDTLGSAAAVQSLAMASGAMQLLRPMVVTEMAITTAPARSSALRPALSAKAIATSVATTLIAPSPTEARMAEELLWNPTEWKILEA